MFAPLKRRAEPFELPLKDTHPDGSLVYKVVTDFKQLPTWPIRPQEPATGLGGPAALQWRTEGDPLQGGAFIVGPPGTGKTWYMRSLMERLRGDCYTVLPMAYTHSAAHNLGGETADTVLHFLHGHKRNLPNAAKTWIFIDEISQVPLKLLPQLLNFMWLGVKFVVGGDFNQQLPIGEVWGEDAVLRLEHSAALHHMCNGLRLEFTECRRSDSAHFCVYTYPLPDHRYVHNSVFPHGPVPLEQRGDKRGALHQTHASRGAGAAAQQAAGAARQSPRLGGFSHKTQRRAQAGRIHGAPP